MALAVLIVGMFVAACSSSSTTNGGGATGSAPGSDTNGSGGSPGTTARRGDGKVYVYWDQDEEEEFITPPSTDVRVLIPPWDPNGQMCLLPDGSGRFVTGYNPTNPDSQGSNPGSKKQFKDPPVGEALWNADGSFSGTTFYVRGPYKNISQGGGSTNDPDASGDIPPDSGSKNHYNDNGTFTGCAFGRNGNLYASDLGTAQGDIPPPDTGRLIMWFAPDYKNACIVTGPTEGGDGPHHVDGHGGLRNPGAMTADRDGNVYVPEAGSVDAAGQAGHGRVLKVDTTTVPQTPAECPKEIPTTKPTITPLISDESQPFPLGVALDPTCDCLAVSNVFGGSAVAWYDLTGKPVNRPPVPSSNAYNPFGLAFTPDGTLYFVDIHVAPQPSGGFGPTDGGGGVYRVHFDGAKRPTLDRIAGGMSFPTSVTSCDGTKQTCPTPTEDNGPPLTQPDKGAAGVINSG